MQVAVLKRVGVAGTIVFDTEPKPLSINALRDRGLVRAKKTHDVWTASVTDAGRFYLAHGYHPDRPDSKAASDVRKAKASLARSTEPLVISPSAADDQAYLETAAEAARAELRTGIDAPRRTRPVKDPPVPSTFIPTKAEADHLWPGLDVPRISFTPAQAALATGMSTTMLMRAIRRPDKVVPKLRAKQVGSRYVVPAAEILRWIARLPDA